MNQLSKKAIASILSLVLVFVALGATTFAWFTLGNTATVGNFDLTARGSEGLEISIDEGANKNWVSNLNANTMQDFINSKLKGDNPRLDAVTTINGVDFKKMGEVTIVESKGVVDTGDDAKANEEYLEFDLHFRTKSDKSETVNLSSLVFSSTGKNEDKEWTPDVEYYNEAGILVGPGLEEPLKLNAHYASRVSFQDHQNNDAVRYQHGEDTVTGSEMPNIGFVTTTIAGNQVQLGAHHYLAKKFGEESLDVSSSAHDAQISYANGARVFNSSNTNDVNNLLVLDQTGGGYMSGTLTIRIWLEGWDGNTYDAIFDHNFGFSFEFTLVRP